MTRVLSGAVLIALAIAVVWFAPLVIVEAVAFVVLFAGVAELITLFSASGVQVPRWAAIVAALATLSAFTQVLSAGDSADAVLMAALIALAIVVMIGWRGGAGALQSISAALFPSIYLAIPIGAIVSIRESAGPAPLFLLMLTVIVSDTAQYYAGRTMGRTLLAPLISPKKTIEGAVGGVIFGTIAFAVVGAWWLPIVPVAVRVALGAGIVLVGIAGDLFESMLKRSAGVKDSSSMIPGHGGILDRIDALLFAAPFYYLVGRFIRL